MGKVYSGFSSECQGSPTSPDQVAHLIESLIVPHPTASFLTHLIIAHAAFRIHDCLSALHSIAVLSFSDFSFLNIKIYCTLVLGEAAFPLHLFCVLSASR